MNVKKPSHSDKNTRPPGWLLRQGIKFSSAEEFEAFKSGKSERKRSIDEGSSPDLPEPKRVKKVKDPAEAMFKNKLKKLPFDVDQLRKVLSQSPKTPDSTSFQPAGSSTPVSDQARNTLKSSRFRYLNEKLYTQTGAQSLKMFKQDPDAFRTYHQGFMEQAKKWPKDPLTLIADDIRKKSEKLVVADFGCGEARLSASVPNRVHSFDLVALNDRVTVCDMANTPLEDQSVDVAVFCLSLMGTNLRDYLMEANRSLKEGGVLKVAEVESRFAEFPIDDFVQTVQRFGFNLKNLDKSHKYFYLLDFEKVKTMKKKKKLPEFSLKPCIYKKR